MHILYGPPERSEVVAQIEGEIEDAVHHGNHINIPGIDVAPFSRVLEEPDGNPGTAVPHLGHRGLGSSNPTVPGSASLGHP